MSADPVLADLCTWLVQEQHGELPSRLFDRLLTRGRLSVASLAGETSLKPRQVRHGLVVLIQHGLVYYLVGDRETHYEANVKAAYSLIRGGKMLAMAEVSIGPAAKDVLQNLLALGHTSISAITDAYKAKLERAPKAKELDAPPVKSMEHLNSTICRLVEADLVEVMGPHSHMSPSDIYEMVKAETKAKYFPTGLKGEKQKVELHQRVAEALREVQDESKVLRRKLEQTGSFAAKKRRLLDGPAGGGESSEGIETSHGEDMDPVLDQRQLIRANHEKCLVNLRNRYLVEHATEWLGETTGHVYGVLLKLLTKNMPRCATDWPLEIRAMVDDIDSRPAVVTTEEILDNLKTSIDLANGIGKCPEDSGNRKWAEKLKKQPRKYTFPYMIRRGRSDDDGDDSSDWEGHFGSGEAIDDKDNGADSEAHVQTKTQPPVEKNSTRHRVQFSDSAAKDDGLDRRHQLREHLLLLSHSSKGFLRHCATEEWTVDFDPLVKYLQDEEMYAMIENEMGIKSRRLVRILWEKGKMSDKMLPKHALMEAKECRMRMNQMFVSGFVDTQEVPIDQKADIQKSYVFWHYPRDQAMSRLLHKTRKTMLNHVQYLDVLRRNDHDVLETAKRTDVRGREKERMEDTYYQRYASFLDNEQALFRELMRLDDLVTVLIDYGDFLQ